MRDGLEGFSLALFTRNLGWSVEEVQVLLSKARKDMGDKNIHAQNDLYDYLPRRTKPGLSADRRHSQFLRLGS